MAKELEISLLHSDMCRLRRMPPLPRGAVATQARPSSGGAHHRESSIESRISGLGHRYALTVNLFIRHCEFKPSINEYDSNKCFGTHLEEGNFRELLDWLTEEWREILWENMSLFVKEVRFLI